MIQLTRSGKYAIYVTSPVMPAAGTMGFANAYLHLIDTTHLGAFVTNPVTLEPWSPAAGTRVVPLDAGVLIHSGLPNPGLSRVIRDYRNVWLDMKRPVIVHLVATGHDHIRQAVERLDREESVMGVELGLPDDLAWQDAETLIKAATEYAEKPVLVRLPVNDAYVLAPVAVDAGADALVVAAPPRGIARDPHSGRLITGRVYSPTIKPIALRLVSQIAGRMDAVPIIGAGGIHSVQDARDFLEAGAVAVQVDSVTWVQPSLLAEIAQTIAAEYSGTRRSNPKQDDISADDFRRMFGDES